MFVGLLVPHGFALFLVGVEFDCFFLADEGVYCMFVDLSVKEAFLLLLLLLLRLVVVVAIVVFAAVLVVAVVILDGDFLCLSLLLQVFAMGCSCFIVLAGQTATVQ